MQWKLLKDGGERVFAVIFQTGDEAIAGLKEFCKSQDLKASRFTAIGAFSDATVGYFDWQTKDYVKLHIGEQVEVVSLIGDVTLQEQGGGRKLHAHVTVAKRDATVHGGHLFEAFVRPTLEVIVTEEPAFVRRRHDPESGLALIDLSERAAGGDPK